MIRYHLGALAVMTHAIALEDGQFNRGYLGLLHRCNRLRCPLAGLSGLQCFHIGHNGHGINLYGVFMILMGNLYAGGQSNLGYLSLLHRY